MIVYQTTAEGFYVCETVADVDPLDATGHLIPAGCVTDAPPGLTEGQRAKWLGESWSIINPVEPEPDIPTYADNRARSYPSKYDYLDGIVKGDQSQIDAYMAGNLV